MLLQNAVVSANVISVSIVTTRWRQQTAVKDQNREVAVQCALESSFASLEGKWHVVSTITYATNDINLRGKSKSRYQTMLR